MHYGQWKQEQPLIQCHLSAVPWCLSGQVLSGIAQADNCGQPNNHKGAEVQGRDVALLLLTLIRSFPAHKSLFTKQLIFFPYGLMQGMGVHASLLTRKY